MQRPTLTALLLGSLALSACQTASDTRSATESGSAPAAVESYASQHTPAPPPAPASQRADFMTARAVMPSPEPWGFAPPPVANTERYDERSDNPVQRTSEQPVSTFSIDVDTGSYSNVRRMLRNGIRPPADAVRAEEFINYFSYGHAAPESADAPFKVSTELAPAPWNPRRHLLMIGIKGYDVPRLELPPANLVFLIDTSGSMNSHDKLPLLKQAFAELVGQMRAQDRVSIVAYAGSAGVVLPPTPGDRHDEINAAIARLQAGGSTNGGDGMRVAYSLARQSFVEDGVNRVILASDGDFNVGNVDGGTLETLVGDRRRDGIALTVLGFGQGNYNDALAQRLAQAGDGKLAYIDTLREARKVLVEEMSATLLTIANDVKIQLEFNPPQVAEYRLIGYENRLLQREDFDNDRVDAGDIGAGHEVTALYEVALVGSGGERLPALRYGTAPAATDGHGGELAHLRLRYKLPGQEASRLIETPVTRDSMRSRPGPQLRFAASVAAFADALHGGAQIDGWDWEEIEAGARASVGEDPWQLRGELVELIGTARRQVQAAESAGGPAR